ncbi:MAG: DUF4296 domain-containing protein [Bacteroidota bacterium]
MKRFFVVIVVCVSFYACKPGIPENIIQPDKMEKILFDIHIVDGYLTNIPKPDTLKIVAASYYPAVYKKFGIDSASYNRSMNYYYSHPDLLDKIYESLLKTFDKEKKSYEKVEALQAQYKAASERSFFKMPDLPYEFAQPIGVNPFNLLNNLPQ